MPTKLAVAIAFVLGYLFGTRSGQKRYEQIRRTARALAEQPSVQQIAAVLQAQLARLALRPRAPRHLNQPTLTGPH